MTSATGDPRYNLGLAATGEQRQSFPEEFERAETDVVRLKSLVVNASLVLCCGELVGLVGFIVSTLFQKIQVRSELIHQLDYVLT